MFFALTELSIQWGTHTLQFRAVHVLPWRTAKRAVGVGTETELEASQMST